VQALIPDAGPAYLVTDYSYLLFGTEHDDDASLAGDGLKGSLIVGRWEGVLTRSGFYRIRPVNKDFLMYIGETGRTLLQRLHNLRRELRNRDLMP